MTAPEAAAVMIVRETVKVQSKAHDGEGIETVA